MGIKPETLKKLYQEVKDANIDVSFEELCEKLARGYIDRYKKSRSPEDLENVYWSLEQSVQETDELKKIEFVSKKLEKYAGSIDPETVDSIRGFDDSKKKLAFYLSYGDPKLLKKLLKELEREIDKSLMELEKSKFKPTFIEKEDKVIYSVYIADRLGEKEKVRQMFKKLKKYPVNIRFGVVRTAIENYTKNPREYKDLIRDLEEEAKSYIKQKSESGNILSLLHQFPTKLIVGALPRERIIVYLEDIGRKIRTPQALSTYLNDEKLQLAAEVGHEEFLNEIGYKVLEFLEKGEAAPTNIYYGAAAFILAKNNEGLEKLIRKTMEQRGSEGDMQFTTGTLNIGKLFTIKEGDPGSFYDALNLGEPRSAYLDNLFMALKQYGNKERELTL